MTPAEAAGLLTICAGFDNRKPDPDQAKAWAMALDGLRFVDCRDAIIGYYRRHREWIMPSDVIDGVKKIRHDRIMSYGPMPHVPDGVDGPKWVEWHAEIRRQMGDGTYVPEEQRHMESREANLPLAGRSVREGLRSDPTNAREALAKARAAAEAGRQQFQATVKPEAEPLLTDADLTREPEDAHPAHEPKESA